MTTTSIVADRAAEAVVTRQFDAMNRHDADGTAASYRPDAIVTDPMYPEPLRGRDAIARDLAELFAAIPDLRMEKGRLLAAGGGYAVELTMRGTHGGPFMGPAGAIPATGRSIELGGACFVRLDEEGRIAQERRYYDLAGLLSQLGLNP